ncbi:MAG TPA: hypothetical protein VHL53_13415, partial [Acidimicrobiia bacterium]|nr:hypothetical protein [Acidimicrobiia bacterium]
CTGARIHSGAADMKRLLTLLLALGLMPLSACSGHAKQETLTVTSYASGPNPQGRFFATAGPSDNEADLYYLLVGNGVSLYALTDSHRTFGVDGCDKSLTVNVAGADVDFQDALRHFDAGTLSPIDGLGDGKGALASVARDCRMVFVRLDRTTNPPTDHLMLFDPATRAQRELYAPGSQKVLGVAGWSPDGRVAVFEGTAPSDNHPTVPTAIVIIRPDGSTTNLAPPVSSLGTLQWGAKWLAISDEQNHKTLFVDPDSGERTELDGWTPLAWSPDGSELIVADAAERKTLALVESTSPGVAHRLGRTQKVQFETFLWLPLGASAGGSLPVGRRADDGGQ